MNLDVLKNELLQSLEKHFLSARIESKERRGVILALRAYIDEETFVEAYANSITGKKSFALISKGTRLMGFDNYKLWHFHPPDNPDDHL